jgi:predicted nucleotidyltransferase component of viral defense system
VNRNELRRYIGVTGHTLAHVEKDYLQHIVLATYSRNLAGHLVFKGGTALQKLGVVGRFSEDLDFTMTGVVEAERLRKRAIQALGAYNYPSRTDNDKDDDRSMSFRLRIEGPLWNGDPISLTSLRVEVSKREDVLLPASRNEIAPPYQDLMPYVLSSMDLREVLAEKIRTIATRSKARDLYDVAQLARRGIEVDPTVLGKKMDWTGRAFDPVKVLETAEHIEGVWDKELRSLLEHVPPYDEAYSVLEKVLEDITRKASVQLDHDHDDRDPTIMGI